MARLLTIRRPAHHGARCPRGPGESRGWVRVRSVRHREILRSPREPGHGGRFRLRDGWLPVISQRAREKRIVEKLRAGMLSPATPTDIPHPRSGGEDRCHGCDEPEADSLVGENPWHSLCVLFWQGRSESVRERRASDRLGGPERHSRASAMDDRCASGPAGGVRGAPAKLRGVCLGPGGGGPPSRAAAPERRQRTGDRAPRRRTPECGQAPDASARLSSGPSRGRLRGLRGHWPGVGPMLPVRHDVARGDTSVHRAACSPGAHRGA